MKDRIREHILQKAGRGELLKPHELDYLWNHRRAPLVMEKLINITVIVLGIVFIWAFLHAN